MVPLVPAGMPGWKFQGSFWGLMRAGMRVHDYSVTIFSEFCRPQEREIV